MQFGVFDWALGSLDTVGGLLVGVLGLAVVGFFAGRLRARSLRNRSGEALHSLPSYHGAFVLILTALPALLLLAAWQIAQPIMVKNAAFQAYPAEVVADKAAASLQYNSTLQLVEGLGLLSKRERSEVKFGLAEIRSTLRAQGAFVPSVLPDHVVEGAYIAFAKERQLVFLRKLAVPGLALAGLLLAYFSIGAKRRTRIIVETVTRWLLIAASGVAILTTFGIVFSLLFETLRFFQVIPPTEFFFGTRWDPGFESAGALGGEATGFGLIPLLWGTLYISLIALLIAVPIGLYAAIYMSEFAPAAVRSVAKPVLEILAGIPTIVYGFFALITVGPAISNFFQWVFLNIFGFEQAVSASSVLTAGVVMGIMIIPFVSSLSDDIINAVPQSLRDGSYALGATKAETAREVVLPAALPGIVGAVLLAASRAIGETMIVVLAAGATARMSLNPLENMTTITVQIVGQVTGDVDFTSPQALVAFALGITLFVVTLVMNVMALRIVNKYREKYE